MIRTYPPYFLRYNGSHSLISTQDQATDPLSADAVERVIQVIKQTYYPYDERPGHAGEMLDDEPSVEFQTAAHTWYVCGFPNHHVRAKGAGFIDFFVRRKIPDSGREDISGESISFWLPLDVAMQMFGVSRDV